MYEYGHRLVSVVRDWTVEFVPKGEIAKKPPIQSNRICRRIDWLKKNQRERKEKLNQYDRAPRGTHTHQTNVRSTIIEYHLTGFNSFTK